ncbi:ABC transmembrane type-1 domain-containing protein [Pseudoscourfieldia marina]
MHETLGTNWNIYLYTIATSLGMFALVCIIVPPFLALAIPAGILYCALLSYYSRTSRATQRIEAVQRAPAYALLSEALAGVANASSQRTSHPHVRQGDGAPRGPSQCCAIPPDERQLLARLVY